MLVRGIIMVFEGGPALALSQAIFWLFLTTSCTLLVTGQTDKEYGWRQASLPVQPSVLFEK